MVCLNRKEFPPPSKADLRGTGEGMCLGQPAPLMIQRQGFPQRCSLATAAQEAFLGEEALGGPGKEKGMSLVGKENLGLEPWTQGQHSHAPGC
jgi:hypothetical protein